MGNPYLSRAAFTALSQLISTSIDEEEGSVNAQLPQIIAAIHNSAPVKTDTTQSPAWALASANAFVAYHSVDPSGAEKEFTKIWKSIWTFLESNDSATRKAAAEALNLLAKCFDPSMINSAVQDPGNSPLGKVISQCQKSLNSLSFARSIPEHLSVISSIIACLRYRDGPTTATAAEVLMSPIIQQVGALRIQKNFEHKETADATLGVAMRVLGPEAFLKLLPLNLEPADR
jgi:ribosomal RNA-processing protein 12